MGGIFVCVAMQAAFGVPAVDDIDRLASRADLVGSAFADETVYERLGLQCCPEALCREDMGRLHGLTVQASEELSEIIGALQSLREEIAEYAGADWEQRYGRSGLWRKLVGDLQRVRLIKCEVDYYAAASAPVGRKAEAVRRSLEQIASWSSESDKRAFELMRVLTLLLVSDGGRVGGAEAFERLDSLLADSVQYDAVYFRTAIAAAGVEGYRGAVGPGELWKRLQGSACRDNFEVSFCLAWFFNEEGDEQALRKVVDRWPESEELVARFTFACLQERCFSEAGAGAVTDIQAGCAARYALENGPQGYEAGLERLASLTQGRVPAVLYAAGLAKVESRPAEAVRLLLEAARSGGNPGGNSAEQVAVRAVRLAFELCRESRDYCSSAADVFQAYVELADSSADEQLEYAYTGILRDCGRDREATELLGDIAATQDSPYRHRAEYDLILSELPEESSLSGDIRPELLQRVRDLIANTAGCSRADGEIRRRASVTYCELLLAAEDSSSSRKVLDFLSGADDLSQDTRAGLRARAFARLGRVEEATVFLSRVVGPNSCEYSELAFGLAADLLEEIDEREAGNSDFASAAEAACRLARYAHECFGPEGAGASMLVWAELCTFCAETTGEFDEIESLLEEAGCEPAEADVDLLRCRARLSMARGEFEQAARLWRRVAGLRSASVGSAGSQGRRWWRAKYYELECLSKRGSVSADRLRHAIDVLENSYADIPAFWAERLTELKNRLAVVESGRKIGPE